MSTLKTDAITAATGTNTDLDLSGKGTGVPDISKWPNITWPTKPS